MGKSSLANTFARYLKSPKDIPTPVLTEENPDLLCTQVMQLYDGLSINKMKDLSVQVEELPPSVKLVKLKPNLPVRMGMIQLMKKKFTSSPETTAFPEEIQLKIVDMGGHTVTVLESFHFHL